MTTDNTQPPSDTDTEQDSRQSPAQSPAQPPTQPPHLRIVRGDPTPEELAALVAVVASLGSAPEPPTRRTPAWSAPHRGVRVTLPHGPGGWRASSLPH